MSYVLLVEDNQDNAAMIIRLLESLHLEVRHTTHGLEGAKMARKHRPALILMDFNLPNIDGKSLILILRTKLGGDSAPPFVAITARKSSIEKQLAERFGCSAFISKPFEPGEFVRVIKSLLPRLTNSPYASYA